MPNSLASKVRFAHSVIEQLENSYAANQTLVDNVVSCECDCNSDEDELVSYAFMTYLARHSNHTQRQCQFCKLCQHVVCYGYLGIEDPRMPDLHVCYTCLLGGKEEALLRQLKDMALGRKVARAVLGGTCHTEYEVSKAIGTSRYHEITRVCRLTSTRLRSSIDEGDV